MSLIPEKESGCFECGSYDYFELYAVYKKQYEDNQKLHKEILDMAGKTLKTAKKMTEMEVLLKECLKIPGSGCKGSDSLFKIISDLKGKISKVLGIKK